MEKQSKHSFDNLDRRILIQIFSNLNPHHCQSLRGVCFGWKSIIDENFGFSVRNWKCIQPKPSLMIFEVINFGDSNFHLILPILNHNSQLQTLIINLQVIPQKRTKSVFDESPSMSSSYTVIALPSNFSYEKTICLVNQRSWLPNLKKCKIICPNGDEWQHMRTVYLLFHLLQTTPVEVLEFFADGTDWELPLQLIFRITIPRVNIFSQDVETQFFHDGFDYIPNVKYVPVHLLLKTLRTIKFQNDYKVDIGFEHCKPNYWSHQNKEFNIIPSRIISLEDSSAEFVGLKSVRFRIGTGRKWLSSGWAKILLTQSALEKLNYEIHFESEMRKHVRRILVNNHQTLKILQLYGTVHACYGMESFDGEWFHNLINLEILELIGETSEDKIYYKNLFPMLVRPWNLPRSLKTLVIHGTIDCGKVSLIQALENLRSLQSLELLGRYQSPWFFSNWEPIYEIDSSFVQNLQLSLSELRNLKLVHLQRKPSQGPPSHAYVKEDQRESWRIGSRMVSMKTEFLDENTKEILCTRVKTFHVWQ